MAVHQNLFSGYIGIRELQLSGSQVIALPFTRRWGNGNRITWRFWILHGFVPSGASFRNDPLMNKQYNNFRTAYWKWRAKQYEKGQKK